MITTLHCNSIYHGIPNRMIEVCYKAIQIS